MSKLNELILKFCPEGVPYLPISEIGTLTRGKRFVHADAVDDGIPCIHYGELYTYYGIWTDSARSHVRKELASKLRYAQKNDVIIVGAGENDVDIGIAVAYLGDEQVAIHDACYILHHSLDPKYISYCLRTEDYHRQIKKYVSSGKICAISAEGIGKAVIPVPPLEVQREIVRVLDNFTFLSAELSAELSARRKQYEYYRNQLLTFGSPVRVLKIQDICEISRGKVISKEDIKDNPGIYPVYSSQTENKGELGKISSFMYDGEYLTWTTDGANAGTVFFRTGKFNITNVCGLLKVNPQIANIRYLFHALSIEAPKHVSRGMGNPKLMSNVMGSIKVNVPDISIQNRIANVLDNFDAICTDLNIGLPAEIEARQKQYEYYRDLLLTFAESGSTLVTDRQTDRQTG